MTNSRYSVVKARIESELLNIERLFQELESKGMLKNNSARKKKMTDQFILRAIGSVFHDIYSSLENIFKVVARYIDDSIPDSPEWHIEILQQMATQIPDIRPSVISNESRDMLNELRSFRHIFRNVYGFNLIAERMEYLLDLLPSILNHAKNDITDFITQMESIISK